MCVIKRNPWLFGLGVLLAVLVVYGGHARADVTTDQSGSVVVFPKVIADGTRDTIIQIANKGNLGTSAHCIYVNNVGTCSITGELCYVDLDCPVQMSGTNACAHVCTENDFDIDLTGQQPTLWDVGLGRRIDPTDGFPGIDPGLVIQPPLPFRGELLCVEVDATNLTGAPDPVSGNHLTGEACLFNDTMDPDEGSAVSDYSAVTVQAGNQDAFAQDLNLNSTEYNACPGSLIMNHRKENAPDDFPLTTGTIETQLTLVPCTQDLLHLPQNRMHASVTFLVTDEMENSFSINAVPVDCMLNMPLGDIQSTPSGLGPFATDVGAGIFRKTRIVPASGDACLSGDFVGAPCTADTDCCNLDINGDPTSSCILSSDSGQSLGCLPAPGVIGVAEEFHSFDSGSFVGNDAFNLFGDGTTRPGAPTSGIVDIIVLPPNE